MTLRELKEKIKIPLFSLNDVVKLFPGEPRGHINTQLYRMITRGDLVGVKRGLYGLPNASVDEFVVANRLYAPSYVSLESALNVYGVIPDVPAAVTSVTTVTSKSIKTPLGEYFFSKINKDLFYGYKSVLDERSGMYYQIAEPEKALLDYIYVRKVKSLSEYRVDMPVLNKSRLLNLSIHFPNWVRKVVSNA